MGVGDLAKQFLQPLEAECMEMYTHALTLSNEHMVAVNGHDDTGLFFFCSIFNFLIRIGLCYIM